MVRFSGVTCALTVVACAGSGSGTVARYDCTEDTPGTGDAVEIEGCGDGTIDFVLGGDGLWTVPDTTADTEWIRCRRLVR